MFIPASLQLELKPRLSREDAERIIGHIESVGRDLAAAREELAEANSKYEQLKAACAREEYDIQQTLGKALGYPWFKDDQTNFPGATEENGVCVGEHVAVTLAMEAAKQLAAANATVDKCKAAGFIDEQGNVRKVLGTLPITADGVVVGCPGLGNVLTLYAKSGNEGKVNRRSASVTCSDDDCVNCPHYNSVCHLYSTRTAAEAARDGKENR
jgi:hypothetical protein